LILFFIYYGLSYAFNALGFSTKKKNISLVITLSVICGWLAVSGILALRGFFTDFNSLPPRLLVSVIPPALAIGYISASERVNNILRVLPKSWMIYAQTFRLPMEIFLFLMLINGALPVQMTFEGRNFDIITGITAPVIAYYSYNKKLWPKIVPLLWNLAGILLVTNVFITGVLSAPGPLRKFLNEPSNTMISHFPFVWIAALIVPFAYQLHVLSIKQIMRFDEDIT
jgi:hypothetical protein